MKKKFLTCILFVLFIIPCIFVFCACSTTAPADIEFKVKNGYIQYYDGSNWTNLIAIEDLKGEQGDPGIPGSPGNPGTPGADADVWTIGNDGYWYKNGVKTNSKAVGADGTGISQITKDYANSDESQTTYKIYFTDGNSYSFVVKNGIDGEDLIAEEISVYFDLNIPTRLECISNNLTKYFTNYEVKNDLYKKDLKKGDRISLMDLSQEEIFKDYFLGWYENVDDNESKFTSLTIMTKTLTLTAKWDDKKIEKDFTSSEGLVFTNSSIVSSYNGTDTDLVIPKYREENGQIYEVTQIRGYLGIGATHNGLTSITLPNSILVIAGGNGIGTFKFCSTLNAVYVEDLESWLAIGFDQPESNPLSQAKSLYVNGELLTNLVIPTSVNRIKDYAFTNCDSIVTISMGSNIKTIGHRAFENCDSLVSVVVPYGVTNIGNSVFSNCQNLVYAKISDSVLNMGSDMFHNCTRLATAEISKNLTTIPNATFDNCASLNITSISAENIDAGAFYNCTSLKKIDLSKVKSIGKYAFGGCINLNEVLFGSSLEYIGGSAFDGCSEELFSISNNARYLNGKILYDIIDVDVTDFICASDTYLIAEDAMAGLMHIENITLTEDVRFINLNKDRIYSYAKIDYNLYGGGYYLGTSTNPYYAFIMPYDTLTGEQSIKLHADTKIIVDNAFDDEGSSYNTIYITIPEGVTHIGRYALSGLKISRIIFLSTVQYISSNQRDSYSHFADLVIASTDIEYIDKVVEAMGVVKTVYLKEQVDITDSTYFAQNFIKRSPSDLVGYYRYVFKRYV